MIYTVKRLLETEDHSGNIYIVGLLMHTNTCVLIQILESSAFKIFLASSLSREVLLTRLTLTKK